MLSYLAQRLSLSLFMLFLVATFLFLFIRLMPGDPALTILGGDEANPSPAQLERVRAELGLDRPLHEQYISYLTGILRGDLGKSFRTGEPVAAEVRLRLGRTLLLVVPSVFLSSVLGISVGALAAQLRGRLADGMLSSAGLIFYSVPGFVVGTAGVLVLALWRPWLPSSGFIELSRDPLRFLSYLVLPVGTLAIRRMAMTMRMTRTTMLEQLTMDYVRTARAKGLSERSVVTRHVLRNALLPVVTVIGLQLGSMFGGAMVVENLFNWPGLNRTLLISMNRRDYPMIMGCMLVTSTIFVAINLLTDLSYAVIDPRIGQNS